MEIESIADLIAEYIELLGTKLAAFRDIKKVWIKTTHEFFGAIRLELRNKLDKVNKEIEDGTLVIDQGQDAEAEEEDQADEDADADEEEAEEEEEQEDEELEVHEPPADPETNST